MGRMMGRGTLGVSSWFVSIGAATFVASIPVRADAQPAGRRHPEEAPTVVQRDPAAEAVQVGRSRLAKGDYAGALEAFDAAVRTSIDPTVRRDRGLCHEQLGHPFPAMEDFRFYLTALPDAPDAEDIRNRLNQVELANGLGGTGTGGETASVPGAAPVGPAGKNEDPFAVDAKDPNAKGAPVAGTGDQARAGNYDQELRLNERWDDADSSPLRRGTGLVFGAYTHDYGTLNGLYGYGIGATLRGSLGPVSTLYGEIGYATYRTLNFSLGEGGATNANVLEGGVSFGLGYEARVRLDQFASNALIFAILVGYERMSGSSANTSAPITYNYLDPRAKFGYRHVFGPGFGIEIGAEVSQPIDLQAGTFNMTTFGGEFALLVGF